MDEMVQKVSETDADIFVCYGNSVLFHVMFETAVSNIPENCSWTSIRQMRQNVKGSTLFQHQRG
jgi:hypothetical protein